MDYILKGNPQDVEKVIRENRIRVQRGVISFTPLDADVHTDNSETIASLQARCDELEKGFNQMSKELSDACLRANDLQTTINRLKEAGVDVDLILDEPIVEADIKDVLDVTDTKDVPESDSKVPITEDVKVPEATPEADTKTPKTSKRTKKTE